MISLIYFILVLTIVVFVHELGHFLVAKACGVKILEFSIGFGKKLVSHQDKNGVIWKICAFPLGGYVKMFGDDNASGAIGYKQNPSQDDLKYSLMYKHPIKKIAVASAGPIMNFILAILLFFAIFTIKGIPTIEPTIGKIVKNSIAEKMGLMENDELLSINNKKITNFNNIRNVLNEIPSGKINIAIIRDNKQMIKTGDYIAKNPLGVASKTMSFQTTSLSNAIKMSFTEVGSICKQTAMAIGNIIIYREGLKSIGGPITIAKESAKAGQNGLWYLVYFIALISVSLGIINIMPIPLLDGGHVVVSFIELVFFHRLPNIAYQIFTYAGYVAIGLLMFLGFFNDLFVNR